MEGTLKIKRVRGDEFNIAVIVGNGLSVDLRNFHDIALRRWNPSSPLEWTIPTPGQPDVPFLESLPYFRAGIAAARIPGSELSDFDLFNVAVRSEDVEQHLRAEVESRHFLAVAFSHFDQAYRRLDLAQWPWKHWMCRHAAWIRVAVSFNYDRVLERVFHDCLMAFNRAVWETMHRRVVPFFKPHGSIDFSTTGMYKGPALTYPLRGFLNLNNTPLMIMNDDDLLSARAEAVAVLPGEINQYREYQWSKRGFSYYSRAARQLTHCVVIGHSYGPADRSEFDAMLAALPLECQVVIANPAPPAELVRKLEQMDIRFEQWPSGPVELGRK